MTTLNIRGIDGQAVEKAKLAAGSRGWTVGRYFEALVELHEAARIAIDHPEGAVGYLREQMNRLGLETRTT